MPDVFTVFLNKDDDDDDDDSRGRGRGGLEPPQKFSDLIKFCYKSGIFLLKWTAVNGS